jgi:uncharacterized protein YcnI
MNGKSFTGFTLTVAATLLCVAGAFAHVTVTPTESALGKNETYVMRVPNERDSPTVRIEVQFPLEANIGYFEQKAPWKLELKRDDKKKILSAVWSGGVLNLNEYAEFKFSARNPAAAGTLTWKVTQIYENGTKSEWTPATEVK